MKKLTNYCKVSLIWYTAISGFNQFKRKPVSSLKIFYEKYIIKIESIYHDSKKKNRSISLKKTTGINKNRRKPS